MKQQPNALHDRLRKALFALVLLAGGLHAQTNSSSIRGTVSDASGAVVPDVKVVITNLDTGIQVSSKANQTGDYLIEFIMPGRYKAEAEVPGFKKFLRDNITLEAARQLRVDVRLDTGQTNETISVTGQTDLVQTESGAIGTVIPQEILTALPNIGRDPRTLVNLVPGAFNGSVNGGLGTRYDPYYMDGVNNTWHVFGDSPVNPNPDVIQEIQILTNSYSAEYGDASGFSMIAITKSGTNQYHGTLFEFNQNDKYNTDNYFTHTRPVVRFNQFGGTAGGPIKRNKTFIFGDVQFTRQHSGTVYSNASLPTAAFRNGDFSALLPGNLVNGNPIPLLGTDDAGRSVYQYSLFDPHSQRQETNSRGQLNWVRNPFPGNVIPQQLISPAARKIAALYPTPQLNLPFRNYNTTGTGGNSLNEFDIKVDHNMNDTNRLTVRFSSKIFDQPGATIFGPIAGGTAGGHFQGTARQAQISYVRVLGARSTNNLILGWSNRYPVRDQAGEGGVSEHDLGIFGMPNGAEKLGLPRFSFSNFEALGSTPDTLFREWQTQDSLQDTFSLTHGRHSLKFGGSIRLSLTNNLQPQGLSGSWTFNNVFTSQQNGTLGGNSGLDFASFLLGLPSNYTYRIFPDFLRLRSSVWGLFVQDDYRLTRKLTVNLGIRWDVPTWLREAGNRSGVFDLAKLQYVQFGKDGFRNTLYENTYLNFDPRFGFAYSPFADQKTVVRGGFAVFHVGNNGLGAATLPVTPVFADGDQGRYSTTDNIHWRTTLDSIPYSPADKVGANALSVTSYPARNSPAYTVQWNFNVQRDIFGILAEVAYVGSHGVHLPSGSYNLNAIPVDWAPIARGRFIAPFVAYPQFPNGVTNNVWIGSSAFHSLQVKVQRRFSNGVAFLVSYTHARQIDVNGGFRDPLGNRNLDRGDSGLPRDRIVGSYNWELPFGVKRRWLNKGLMAHVLGGWALNGITSFQNAGRTTPSVTNLCTCGNGAARPNVTGDPNSGFTRSLDQWFNTSVWETPAQYTIGNAGRGLIISGPATNSTSVNMVRQFYLPWREGLKLEFRGEFNNALNQVQLAGPNTTVGNANFGRITTVSAPGRTGQLGLKLYW